MKDIKTRFLKFVKSKKINVFMLFFMLSFTILILNKLSRTFTNTIAFKVETLDLPETFVVLNDSSQTLNITIKTYGFKLLKYYLSKPELSLDYNDTFKLTDSTFVWSQQRSFSKINSQFDKDVELISVFPDTLYFKYDQNATKDVPIVLQEDIKFSPGFDVLEGFKLSRDSVHIIGPEKILSQISQVKTKPVNLQDVHLNINEILELELPKANKHLQFSNNNVRLTAKVEKFTEGTFNVPVTIKNIPKGLSLKYYPKSVSVSYYTNLAGFNDVIVQDFEVECNFEDHVANKSFLIPKLVKQPENVKSAKIIQQRIEFIISE